MDQPLPFVPLGERGPRVQRTVSGVVVIVSVAEILVHALRVL
jgi:hypothetical protein